MLAWGARGRRFKSFRPDRKRPLEISRGLLITKRRRKILCTDGLCSRQYSHRARVLTVGLRNNFMVTVLNIAGCKQKQENRLVKRNIKMRADDQKPCKVRRPCKNKVRSFARSRDRLELEEEYGSPKKKHRWQGGHNSCKTHIIISKTEVATQFRFFRILMAVINYYRY